MSTAHSIPYSLSFNHVTQQFHWRFRCHWVWTNTCGARHRQGKAEGTYCDCIGVGMGRPNDAPRTARGVSSSTPSSSPKSYSGCSWDGGGKTHILQTLSVVEQVITLIFIPLLTLLTNVMHKFEDAGTTWGNVGVYHCLAFMRLLWHTYEDAHWSNKTRRAHCSCSCLPSF